MSCFQAIDDISYSFAEKYLWRRSCLFSYIFELCSGLLLLDCKLFMYKFPALNW